MFSSRYQAAINCFTNDSLIATLYVISDLVLCLALAAIAARMWRFRGNGYLLLPHQTKLAFVTGVLLSIGYLVNILAIYEDVYRYEIILRGAAAGVATVFSFSFWIRRH